MKTIFITIPWFTPAFKAGGPIQSIKNLVEQFHEGIFYKIFCSDRDLNDTLLTGIKTGEWISFNGHTEVWYADKNNTSDTLNAQLELIKPEVLFIVGIFSWHFNIVPLWFGKAPRKILSVRGMLHPPALQQKAFKKKVFLSLFNLSGKKRKISFHATDADEEKNIKNIFGQEVNVFTAPNFPSLLSPVPVPQKRKGFLTMISVAIISGMKNHLKVLEALQNCSSQITWLIYGPVKDTEYWQACLQKIKSLPENILVKYEGQLLPHHRTAAFSRAQIFMLPSESENFGHAFTEAFSSGRPVITSNNTPWNNLAEKFAGKNCEARPKELSAAIEFFAAMDHDELEKYSAGAVRYLRSALYRTDIEKAYQKMFLNN